MVGIRKKKKKKERWRRREIIRPLYMFYNLQIFL